MTDAEIRQILSDRFTATCSRIRAACDRASRSENEVLLLPVTKSVSARITRLVMEMGHHDLGESRPQTIWQKGAELSMLPIRWHMIGHWQTNKIDRTLPYIHLVHSLDRLKLAQALQNEATTPISVLIEVNASREPNKSGFAPEELPALGEVFRGLNQLQIVGLMTMAAHHDDPEQCRSTFAEVRQLRDRLRQDWGLPLDQLSMGMSNDFEVAIEEGATIVRLGTTLFEGLAEE